jgi:hypothetical protein
MNEEGDQTSGPSSGPEELNEAIVLRLPDGSTYFIRKEILDACKVTEEDSLALVEGVLEGSDEVSGFALNVQQPSANVVSVKGSWETGLARPYPYPTTVMCPWVGG